MALLVRHGAGSHGSVNWTAAWMTVGSLCSGIGGFEYGFQLASPLFQIKWQVEIDPFCRKVLAKHWPNVKRYEDLTTLTGDELEPVDLVCAGFPCQPVSVAGARKAKADERWIWPHIARLLGSRIRPRWVVLENTPGLFTAGSRFIESPESTFGAVLGDLAALGLTAEWACISAADVGAPHLRKRVWIVAHANRDRRPSDAHDDGPRGHQSDVTGGRLGDRRERQQATRKTLADTKCQPERPDSIGSDSERFHGRAEGVWSAPGDRSSDGCEGLADTTQRDRDVGVADKRASCKVSEPRDGCRSHRDRQFFTGSFPHQWIPEPDVGRVIPHGLSAGVHRSHRLRAIGNSIVPQIAEWIGRRIIECDQ